MQGRPTGPDMWWLSDYILVTMRIVNPIIDAFQLEGFYHFKPPCYTDPKLNSNNCTKGANKFKKVEHFKVFSLYCNFLKDQDGHQ